MKISYSHDFLKPDVIIYIVFGFSERRLSLLLSINYYKLQLFIRQPILLCILLLLLLLLLLLCGFYQQQKIYFIEN